MKATVIEFQEQDSTSYEQLQDEQLVVEQEEEDKSKKQQGVLGCLKRLPLWCKLTLMYILRNQQIGRSVTFLVGTLIWQRKL
jgi:hypothetical protein